MYSCVGFKNKCSVFETSHNLPSFKTPILSHICLTTGRSWLINKIVKFNCSWRSLSKFNIWAQILNLLKDLQEQLNLTILFISHDLPVVRQMCDRIGVLKDGKLCEVSKTEHLFLKPTHEYTKELLRLMPKIESIYN